MGLATKSVSFSFNEVMYRQVDGISMGSPLGSLMANVFVGFLEKTLFQKVSKPYYYARYVDDTFACFGSRDEALKFFQDLNGLHPSLGFTMEEEKNNSLPFLDVLVERRSSSFLTSIFRKPTFTGLYLSWDSFAPKSRKVNLIKCLTFRALMICSDCKIGDELKTINNIFTDNGYPEDLITKVINQTVSNFNTNKQFGPPKCPVYLRLPWIGLVGQTLANKIKLAIINCFNAVKVRTIFTTIPAFRSSQKDVLPIFEQSYIIYKYQCWCDASYIGRTTQRLNIRINQHVPKGIRSIPQTTSGLSQAQDSAIGDHLCTTNSCRTNYNDRQFSILHKARTNHHLNVLEAVSIFFYCPTLCRQRHLKHSLVIFAGDIAEVGVT